MNHDKIKFFWNRYLGLLCKGGCRTTMRNPLKEFETQARAGSFDDLTDEQYHKARIEAAEISVFWNNGPVDNVGHILLNALSKTEISDAARDKIADILATASLNTDYHSHESEMPYDKDEWEDADGLTPFDDDDILHWTPRNIYDFLNHHIYGQDAAKRAASMLVYHHIHGNSRNILMAGPTGCGKTEIWRTLSKICDCVKIINGPQLSCDGWKGSYHIKDIFLEEQPQKAENLIVVIDEADKLFEPAIGSGGTDYSYMLQNELLKIMDGDVLTFVDENRKGVTLTIDCSGVSIVFCGSFERMLKEKNAASGSIGFCSYQKESTIAECNEEDLIQYANIRKEIAGRINQIITLDTLVASDFEAILDSPSSPIKKLEKAHHVSLSIDENIKKALAFNAAQSGLGCRYIRSKLQAMLDEQMFDTPEKQKFTLCMSI